MHLIFLPYFYGYGMVPLRRVNVWLMIKHMIILELAVLMQSNRTGVSLQDIMDRFGVARRTAERMRDVIIDRFPQVQVRTGENNTKRWYVPQGTLKDFIQFSAEELVAFEKAIAYLQANSMQETSVLLQKILEKIRANIVDKTFNCIDTDAEVLLEAEGFAHRVGPRIIVSQEIIQKIRQAILSFRQIRISYKKKVKRKNWGFVPAFALWNFIW